MAKEFTPEQREILTLKSNYLQLFSYQLYEGGLLGLEKVEPLGLVPRGFAKSRTSYGSAAASHTIEHFGMKADVAAVYELLDKGILSLDSRVKQGKVNVYFIGYGATGSYFCNVKPKVNFIRVDVKCVRKPTTGNILKVRKLPDYHTMTHTFNISHRGQIEPALRVIKIALEDSM